MRLTLKGDKLRERRTTNWEAWLKVETTTDVPLDNRSPNFVQFTENQDFSLK